MAEDITVLVEKLGDLGVNKLQVVEAFLLQHNVVININEYIKVRSNAEGIYINFETLDKISINIDPIYSNGSPNKIEPPEAN